MPMVTQIFHAHEGREKGITAIVKICLGALGVILAEVDRPYSWFASHAENLADELTYLSAPFFSAND